MPTYQYACTECGDGFETVQSFTDDALTQCTVCGGRLRKVFNSVGIVFKGSGFYRTDSREETRSATAAKDRAASGKGSDAKSSESASSATPKSDSTSSGSGSGSGSTPSAKPASSGSGTSSPASSSSSSTKGSAA